MIYGCPRDIATGMMRQPDLSAHSQGNSQNGQQGNTPEGCYGDDRIINAQPYGSLTHEGSIQCTDYEQQFEICDHGDWVNLSSVVAGTTCENEQIVWSRNHCQD